MNILIGNDKWNNNKKIFWNSEEVVNGHMMLIGGSGSGKTHNIRKITKELSKNPKNEVHIIDVHGDIEIGDDITSSLKISESSDYGLNPLKIDKDRDAGGVRKKISSFVRLINRTSTQLGTKQVPTLQNALQDLYAANGFFIERPDSWDVDNEIRKNCNKPKMHPTVSQLKKFLEYKYKQMYIGTNSASIAALERLNKKTKSLNNKARETLKGNDVELETLQEQALEAFEDYVRNITTGMEIEELMKYDSLEVIKSLYERISALEACGIFKDTPLIFDTKKPVKRYDIKSLNKDEQKMFVDVLLDEIFQKAKIKGYSNEPHTFIVIDEAHMFISKEDEHILNVIAKEARKFGVALILASQSFTHFSDDIIQSTATKIILGIDEMFQKGSAQKLQIDVKRFSYIIPHKTCMAQVKTKGGDVASNKFFDIVF